MAPYRAAPGEVNAASRRDPDDMWIFSSASRAAPGSISAIAMHLPVVERNAWTLPQERYNTIWVLEKQLAAVLKSFRDIDAGVRALLDAANFARFRANAAAIVNRMVFEIPDVLSN